MNSTPMKHLRPFLCFVLLSAAALGVALWFDNTAATANNPPTTVLGTAHVDPTEPPPANASAISPVYETLEANGRYYVTGDFDSVGGETRHAIAAIDVATGHIDPNFAPVITGSAGIIDAIAISPDGADLYIGGRFTNVDGVFRGRIAKLDAHTGQLDTTFNANINSQVDTVVTDGASVWAGGTFGTVNGQAINNLVKLDANTGAIDPAWVGTTNGTQLRVRDAELDSNNVLWVGGSFSGIAGTTVARLAPLDPATGNVLAAWNPGPTVAPPAGTPPGTGTPLAELRPVFTISTPPDGSAVYVGTLGSANDSPQGGNAVRKYALDGELLWQRIAGGDAQEVEATNSTVYVGSHGDFVFAEPRYLIDGTMNPNFPANGLVEMDSNPNATRRQKLWSLDAGTGVLSDWDPMLDSIFGVWGLESGPSGLMVGGDFRNIAHPDGDPDTNQSIFSPHFAVFAGEGNLGNAAPQPLFTFDCTSTLCDFDASTSFDDVSIASYSWDFGDGQTAAVVMPPSISLADNTTHSVTLTVTDNTGLTSSLTRNVIVGNGGLPVEHLDTVAGAGFATSAAAQIPASVQTGDVAVTFVSVNENDVSVSAPAGWTQFGDQTNNNLRTFAFWTSLTAADASTNQIFTFSNPQGNSANVRFNITLSSFRGADPLNPIGAVATAATAPRTAQHDAPALTLTGDSALVHYWADRTTDSTQIFAAPALATLNTTIGVGGGHVNSTLAIDPSLQSTASPIRVALTEHSTRSVLGWSIALNAQTCNGLSVTVNLAAGQAPTAGSDVILGTSAAEVINGLGGDDTICGGGGDDTINAGPGNDTVFAGDGNDTVFGLDGNDTIFGQIGNDTLIGFGDNDTIDGGPGSDTINGGTGNDTLDGDTGDDSIFGQAGNDTIDGGDGADAINGVDGDDLILGGFGADVINAGPGADTVNGNAGNDTIVGLTGNDTLHGNSGDDSIFGQAGNDTIDGGFGNDLLLGNEDDDTITDPSGVNTLNGGFGDDNLTGGNGADSIFGDADATQNGNDILVGGGGQDLLVGFAGNDTINAQDGQQDTVNGGPGTDSCTTDTGAVTDLVFNCNP